jgi:hypothetical protein
VAKLALIIYLISEEDSVLEELFKESLILLSLVAALIGEELLMNPLKTQQPADRTGS